MAQNKKMSALESFANVLVGYVVAVLSQMIIFPALGYNISTRDNFLTGIFFTIISLIRSYTLRRIFNKID